MSRYGTLAISPSTVQVASSYGLQAHDLLDEAVRRILRTVIAARAAVVRAASRGNVMVREAAVVQQRAVSALDALRNELRAHASTTRAPAAVHRRHDCS